MTDGGPADDGPAYPRGGGDFKSEFEENGDTEGTTDYTPDSKNHLLDFIQLYEYLPVLWNPAHPQYMKKPTRLAALQRLATVYGRMRRGATEADVRRKINTLRCNYKKELKKVEEARRGGRLYEPSSWVFHRLHRFLREIEPEESCAHAQPQPVQPDGFALSNDSLLSYVESEGTMISCSPDPFSTAVSYPSAGDHLLPAGGTCPPAAVKKSSKRATEDSSKKMRLSSESVDRPHAIPTIARAWGERLETLDFHQKLLAEKAINDVLFEAAMGALTRGYVHEFMPRGEPSVRNSEPPRLQVGDGSGTRSAKGGNPDTQVRVDADNLLHL